MPTRPKMSPIERLEATLRVLEDESPTALAREYGVSVGRIYGLKKEALEKSNPLAWIWEAAKEYQLTKAIAENLLERRKNKLRIKGTEPTK